MLTAISTLLADVSPGCNCEHVGAGASVADPVWLGLGLVVLIGSIAYLALRDRVRGNQ